MYSQFTSSCPLYDKQAVQRRPISTYHDAALPLDRPAVTKSLRWNIEESKENRLLDATTPSSPSYLAQHYSTAHYPLSAAYEHSLKDSKKYKGSKSYKTIAYSTEPYEHERPPFDKGDCLRGKQNLGSTYLANLRPTQSSSNYYPGSYQREEPELKRMKSCKSEKKIRYEPEERVASKPPLYTTFLDRPKEDPNSYSNKSCTNIKLDLARSPHLDKTSSYTDYTSPKKQESKPYLERGLKHSSSSAGFQSAPKQRISLGDFSVGQCKGEGAFGQVFPAIHRASGMLVAIKRVAKEKVRFMLPQFISEIKIQMFLEHPNIVRLYGFFDDPAHFYIVMEFMEGGNLFGLLKKRKRVGEGEAAERVREVCLGLKEMHDNSILHRDIKPENIVITNEVSKLCDFGWAAVCKDRRNTYCGTLDYVSPEIIEGEGYDDSVDIWCIGVLAYELLCGKTPFYNISRKETMRKIRDVAYDYPPDLSPHARAFIDSILRKDPQQRIGIEEVLKHRFLNP